MANLTFNAIDVETANHNRASICQIGLVMVRDGKIGDALSILLNPEEAFEEINTGIHGINRETVRDALTMPLIHPKFRELIDGTVLVSHSSFDRQALERAAEKYGIPMPEVRWLDSGRIARTAWPEQYGKSGWGLKKIAADLEISFRHHDAGEDARVAAEITLHTCRHAGLDMDDWLEKTETQRKEKDPDTNPEPPTVSEPSEGTDQPRWASILTKILTLEKERGFRNSSVSGGLDAFMQRQAENITRDLGDSGVHRILLGIPYADLNQEERSWWARQWREVMDRQQHTEVNIPR